MRSVLLIIILALSAVSSRGQTKTKQMEKQNNPLLCDVETGICEIPATDSEILNETITASTKPIKIIYYTDPICSSCWGIEPQLRKLKLEYGSSVEIEYRMGGLLPDWSYNSGGISKPSDVAHHWDEVSVYYDMPIDGDIWLEDPLSSSYPPSIAFKAAQMQNEKKAINFLREMRELVFLQKKNITKWEHLSFAAERAKLDVGQLKRDYEGQARELFSNDLEQARAMGVRGFPSIFIANGSGTQEMVYGSKPYTVYEQAIIKLQPALQKQTYARNWESLFAIYPTLTAKEFSELTGTPRKEAEAQLQHLTEKKHLDILQTKNGALWSLKK